MGNGKLDEIENKKIIICGICMEAKCRMKIITNTFFVC